MNTYGQTALIRLEKGGRRHTVKKLRKSNNRNDFDFDLNCFIKIGILLEFNTKNEDNFFTEKFLRLMASKTCSFARACFVAQTTCYFFIHVLFTG